MEQTSGEHQQIYLLLYGWFDTVIVPDYTHMGTWQFVGVGMWMWAHTGWTSEHGYPYAHRGTSMHWGMHVYTLRCACLHASGCWDVLTHQVLFCFVWERLCLNLGYMWVPGGLKVWVCPYKFVCVYAHVHIECNCKIECMWVPAYVCLCGSAHWHVYGCLIGRLVLICACTFVTVYTYQV